MLTIKLFPKGKKHQRTFRIVASEKRSKANGSFVYDLGFWTPQTKTFEINKQMLSDLQAKGAQVSEGVDKLLNPEKYPKKVKKTAEAQPQA